MTTQLSYHVQNTEAITSFEFGLKPTEIPVEFELRWQKTEPSLREELAYHSASNLYTRKGILLYETQR